MTIHKVAHCTVIKGNGPDFIAKLIEIYIDDIEDCTPEIEIEAMVRDEIKNQLQGFTHFTIGDIFNC